MEILKEFFFRIIAPMLWLTLFAYGFTHCSLQLEKAWKAKNTQRIWFNFWIILVGVYFLFLEK